MYQDARKQTSNVELKGRRCLAAIFERFMCFICKRPANHT